MRCGNVWCTGIGLGVVAAVDAGATTTGIGLGVVAAVDDGATTTGIGLGVVAAVDDGATTTACVGCVWDLVPMRGAGDFSLDARTIKKLLP